MKRGLRILRKVFFWIFFIALFFVTVLTVVFHVYEDDIKAFAINEINRNLKTKVEVRNIELSFLKDFPNASLGFEHVFIKDAFEHIESNDTLFFAKELLLHFNLLDIYRGQYEVKKASVKTAVLNLKTTKDGAVNYDILNATKDSTSADQFTFKLAALKAEDFRFNFANASTNQVYDLHLNHAQAKGDFTAEEFELYAVSDLRVNALKSGSLNLIKNKNAVVDLGLNINNINQSYTFTRGDLSIETMNFNIGGVIDSAAIDLDVKGNKIQLSEFFNSVIDEKLVAVKKYQSEGLVDFDMKIKGPFSRVELPAIDANFKVNNGSLIEPENQLKIYNINLAGTYNNAQKKRPEKLDINDFKLQLLNGSIQGHCLVEDFSTPTINSKLNGDIDLGAIQQFFKFNSIKYLSGRAIVDLSFVMQFFDPQYRADKFEVKKSSGSLRLEGMEFQSVNSQIIFQEIAGDFRLQGKDVAAKDLKVRTLNSDLVLNGAFKNVFAYLEGSGGLGVIASLESQKIDLNEFLGQQKVDEEEGPIEQFEFPGNLNLNVELEIGDLNWDNHHFNTITGQFLMANRKATVNNIRMNTLGGSVIGKLEVHNLLADGNVVDGNLKFEHINLKQLFEEWENFKQESIKSEHISGFATGDIDILLLFNPYFSIIEEKIYAVTNLEITSGELVNLPTMKAITDYMRSNKALKLMLNKHINGFEKKLQHIKFSNIVNTIEIKDRRMTIPKMRIETSAMDVEVSGWHDFDNNIDYHFSFRFKDLKSKVETSEFGIIEDDGLGIVIYLTMSGSIDNPVYKLDKQERQEDIKANIEQDKTDIKSMLKTDFGLFKKDTTIQKLKKDNKNEVEFIFYDEDSENDEFDEGPKKKKNKTRSSNIFDKLKSNSEQEEKEPQIEIEK